MDPIITVDPTMDLGTTIDLGILILMDLDILILTVLGIIISIDLGILIPMVLGIIISIDRLIPTEPDTLTGRDIIVILEEDAHVKNWTVHMHVQRKTQRFLLYINLLRTLASKPKDLSTFFPISEKETIVVPLSNFILTKFIYLTRE